MPCGKFGTNRSELMVPATLLQECGAWNSAQATAFLAAVRLVLISDGGLRQFAGHGRLGRHSQISPPPRPRRQPPAATPSGVKDLHLI